MPRLFLPAPLLLAVVLAGCSQAPPPATPESAAAPPAAEPVPVLEPVPDAPEGEAAGPEEGLPAPRPGAGSEERAAAGTEAVVKRKDGPAETTATATRPERDATVIAVAGAEPKPRTLWEAAVAAREKRRESPPARTSVTDENLHEFQDAEVTFASPRPARKAEEVAAAEEGSEAGEEAARGEQYWRSRVLDLRLRLRSAVDELAGLDERAADLRRSFYAADDPYVRDSEIKPAWDRALDRIGEVRREIVGLSEELQVALEEGRESGALPGWLREGIELEPEPDELPRPRESAHEPGEPEVMEIESPPPGPSAP